MERRLRDCKMLDQGHGCAEVSKRLGVTRAVVYRWKAAWEGGGKEAVTSKGKAGRKLKLDGAAVDGITQALLAGPRAQAARRTCGRCHGWAI